MALIIVRDTDEIPIDVRSAAMYVSGREQIQHEFCSSIEWEVGERRPFLERADVQEYLGKFGVRYVGNFMLESDDWGQPAVKRQFVTYLNYVLQLACLALTTSRKNLIITERYLFEAKYLLPVLEKKDIYIIDEEADFYKDYLDVANAGVEVIVHGVSCKGMNNNQFLMCLDQIGREGHYLTRKLDAQVFDEKNLNLFEPYEISFPEYVQSFKDFSQYSYDYLLEKAPFVKDIKVKVNGINHFDGLYRRYPIHYLFYINGGWKYISNNSVKNPDITELMDDAFFGESVFDVDGQHDVDVADVKKMMVLILDCDEICDARRYWEHVCFIAKYDKQKNEIEICEKNKGLLEFHELLQKSKDLS